MQNHGKKVQFQGFNSFVKATPVIAVRIVSHIRASWLFSILLVAPRPDGDHADLIDVAAGASFPSRPSEPILQFYHELQAFVQRLRCSGIGEGLAYASVSGFDGDRSCGIGRNCGGRQELLGATGNFGWRVAFAVVDERSQCAIKACLQDGQRRDITIRE